MREIVLDTETTGLDPFAGHRLVEIGCVELINRMPTGRHFHRYLNPERDMPAEAFAVHGLSAEFLQDKPRFGEIAVELLTFLQNAPLVAHNALFDLGFLNAELERAGNKPLERQRLVDTLLLARRKHPAGPNRLDDLCARYGVDNSRRNKHGALLDAEILADVYLDLIGARQAQLILVDAGADPRSVPGGVSAIRLRPAPLAPRLSLDEVQAHYAFASTLGAGAIWLDYPIGGPSAERIAPQLIASPATETAAPTAIQPQAAA